MGYLRAKDTVNGALGTCFVIIDGKRHELMLTNEDPTGDTGRQTVLLKDVNIEEMLIGKLDVDEAAMDEEMKFTFGGVELLDEFDEV